MRIGSLFSGYGGLDMAVAEVFNATTAWVSDIDPGPCKVLAHRFPHAPNLGDVSHIDWSTVEPVDIICGGSPCQDLSTAGRRAGMTEGTRSNLWVMMREAIAQLRPRYVVWENVRGAYSASAASAMESDPRLLGDHPAGQPALRALGRVLGDLADVGYDAQWCGLRAADVGACHGRFRVFLLAADPERERGQRRRITGDMAGATRAGEGDREQRQRDGANGHDRGAATADTRRIGGHEAVEHDGRQAQGGDGRGIPDQRDREPLWTGPDGGLTLLPTPSANLGENGGPQHPDKRRAGGIANLLPTVKASNNENRVSEGYRPNIGMALASMEDSTGESLRWGQYADAIARWEQALGRPAPNPTQPSPRTGKQQLSPAFTEWMMGLPAGWITDVPGITRNEALKLCGNGVVPQQAIAALARLLNIELMERAA